METIDSRDLAQSMVRIYGPPKALAVAEQYAATATALDNNEARKRWAAVAGRIADAIAGGQPHII